MTFEVSSKKFYEHPPETNLNATAKVMKKEENV